jgi:hypothetical protein
VHGGVGIVREDILVESQCIGESPLAFGQLGPAKTT